MRSTAIGFAFLISLGGDAAFAQGKALPPNCIDVKGSHNDQHDTLMVYTNYCDAECASFIPVAQGPGGRTEVGTWNVGVQFATGGRIMLGRNQQAVASWGRKTGTWTGRAEAVAECR